MPAWLGASRTAAFNSACCSPGSAGGNLPTAPMTAPSDHPPRRSWPIGLWCGHPDPRLGLPPLPSNPAPTATPRASVLAPEVSALGTSAVAPQPRPFATAPAVAPSLACPRQTPPMPPTDYLNCLQFYPPLMRVSPWLWFSITVALELRASERVSCKGFQGSGLVPPAPPRLPYRQVSALIK